jgi:hypothetical protein
MSTGLLDFFTLEAGEYIERLDGLIAQAGGGPPALDPFLTDARALRGSATMARQAPIADMATALERLAKALRDSTLSWDAAVQGAVIAAVDDLKILLRNVRTWSAAEDLRARARTEELTRLAPVKPRRSSGVMGGGSFVYVASEAADLATSLVAFVANAGHTDPLLDALPRVRALRGMASLRDLPPLGEVIEAVEDAARPVELGTGPVAAEQIAVLRAAAMVLQRAALELRTGALPDPRGPEAQQFAAAINAVLADASDADNVVPISSLFFDDAGPHVVEAAAAPPTTPAERFRMEVVSQAEHVQRVVGDARAAQDASARSRAGRAIRSALRALRATAASFGENDVAAFVDGTVGPASSLDSLALGAIAEAAKLLAEPNTDPAQLRERLRALGVGRSVDAAIAAGFSPVSQGTPISVQQTEPRLASMIGFPGTTPAQPARAVAPATVSGAPSPRGQDLRSLLATGIAGLTRLDNEPFSPPARIDDESAPISEFLYRGRAALDRALELRDAIRGRGSPPDQAELEELFALLELATTE